MPRQARAETPATVNQIATWRSARFSTFVPGSGVPLGTVDDLDTVEIGAEFDELIRAHLLQFVPRRDVLVTATHARDPIHMAPATMAMTPTNHITMPSLTGPKPPRPSPPLGCASVTYLT